MAEREAAVAEYKQRRREERQRQEASGTGRRISRYKQLQMEHYKEKREEAAAAAAVVAAASKANGTDAASVQRVPTTGRLALGQTKSAAKAQVRPATLLPSAASDSAVPRSSRHDQSSGFNLGMKCHPDVLPRKK